MNKEIWLIWKQSKTRKRYKIGTLTFNNGEYMFKYTNPELNEAVIAGFEYFPGFEDVNKIYRSKELFANIETRLPNPIRQDYLELLNIYGLDRNSSKMEILEKTRGRLLTDNYEFVPAFDMSKIEFDVAGTKYSSDVKKCIDLLNINSKLKLEFDIDNNFDKNAIKVLFVTTKKQYHLGYVPRYYSEELGKLLKNGVNYSAMVKSINFESEINDEDITVYVKLIFNK